MTRAREDRRRAALGDREGGPLHVRVREAIRRQALSGDLVDSAGRLMPEQELVTHFGVSRMTIRSALQPLVAEGIFSRERGRGTFLRSNGAEHWAGRLMGFSEIIIDAGHEPGARVLGQGFVNDHEEAARAALGERAAFELKRLRLADGAPIAIEHAFYPPDIGIELQKHDLTSILMYRVFEEELGLDIARADQTIGAASASPEEAELLGARAGEALITLTRLTVAADGRPLEFLRARYLPEYFHFTVELRRRAP